MRFDHEKLDVYTVALRVARAVQRLPARAHLKDQVARAAESVVLNIAEGAALPPRDRRKNHFRIALGSTAEVSAALDLIGNDGPIADVRRVGMMLKKMTAR